MSDAVDPDDREELATVAAALAGDRAEAARLVGETLAAATVASSSRSSGSTASDILRD